MRRWAAALLVVAACGGNTQLGSTLPEPCCATPPTTTTVTTTTTTTSTTTTTTLPPTTTTTTIPAVPVEGWEGEGIRDAAIAVEADYGVSAVEQEMRLALRRIGIDADDDSDIVFRATLDVTPRSAAYGTVGTCYSGVLMTGTMALESPDDSSSLRVRGDVPTPFVIPTSSCRSQPGGAPFEQAAPHLVVAATVEFFGPGAVPYLADVVVRPMLGDWSAWLIVRRAAVNAYADMTHADIPIEVQYEFLDSVITGLERLVEAQDDEIPPYISAVRQLLVGYSGEDYGFEDQDDLAEWSRWLESWRFSQGG